jgi:hypothetical protein
MSAVIGVIGLIWLGWAMTQEAIVILIRPNRPKLMIEMVIIESVG